MGYYDNPMAYGASSRRSTTISPEDKAARNAGFSSAAAQEANRQMRNQLEMKALMAGMSINKAYGLVQGDLTNTSALQDAWNKISIAPQTSSAAPQPEKITNTNLKYTDPGDPGFFGMKDYEELRSQGATREQIIKYAQEARHGVGAKAASLLGLSATMLTPEIGRSRDEAAQYRQQAEDLLNQFKIEQQRASEAAALQEKMRIESQRTLAANMARSGQAPNFQISPAAAAPQTAGTQAFKRRRSGMGTDTAANLTAGISPAVTSSNVLNV